MEQEGAPSDHHPMSELEWVNMTSDQREDESTKPLEDEDDIDLNHLQTVMESFEKRILWHEFQTERLRREGTLHD